MRSKRSSTRCRARARTPGAPPCSAALQAAISGRAARKIAPTRHAKFCDTDFVGTDGEGGGRFATADELADACAAVAPRPGLIVLTGGEPMLQVDEALVDALHARGFTIAVETNGTLPVPACIDWICVSPKAGTEIKQRTGDELKLVYPQAGLDPEALSGWVFAHRFLQPMDGPEAAANTARALAYCKAHPDWRLSLQTHKILGIP